MYKLPNGTMVYPEDIECVHDPVNGKGGVFIGNLEAAQNLQTLKKHGIRAILTAAKGVFLQHSKTEIPFQLYIPGEDHQKFDISKFFSQSITFIRDALEKTNILVHCLAGVSRSVSLVMAYFIKFQNMGYDDVYTKIKSRRKIIHPNDGFIDQLRKFEAECRQRGPVAQRSEHFEMRSSYSPSKRVNLRGYEGYEVSPKKGYEVIPQKNYDFSPQKGYDVSPHKGYQVSPHRGYEVSPQKGYEVSPQKAYNSPEKRFSKNVGYSEMELSSRYHIAQSETRAKNPQMYRSIAQEFATQRGYKQSAQMKNYSPDKFQKENRMNSSVQLKRLSSANIDLQSQNDKPQRNQIYSNYQRYEVRNRIRSDYKPLDSIQNKQYGMDSEIDRKIAEIRKKYQEYTKKSDPAPERNDRIRLEKRFSNISTIQESNENFNLDDLRELKMRKMGSQYESVSVNDIYGGGVGARNNNYFNEAPSSNASKLMDTRLRRLQSYQV